jgi:hexulose-6-phosphate isomerase
MKKGLNQWCLPKEMSIHQAIELCCRLGYDGLEVNVAAEGELTLDTTPEQLQTIATWARDAGLALPSVATGLHWRYPLSDPSPECHARGMAIARQQLQAAHILGADTILLIVGLVTETESYDQVWERSLAAVQELAEEAARLQVQIGIENVANHFLLSPLEMRDFIDAVDSPWVGAYYDVGNTVFTHQGWPQHWIHILGRRIRKVHVKDHRAADTGIVGAPLLAGDTIHWPQVMKALHAVDYDDYLTVEISPYPHFPTKLAEDAVQSLDALFTL